MRIGILTHYDVNNQGAQLQMYATYMQLKQLGHEPVVLTYKKNYDFEPQLEKRNQITVASVPYIIKHFLLEKGVRLTWHNVRKYLVNKRFREQNFRSDCYCSASIDAALVGADEVFSLELGVNMMMFGHGVNTDNMIAYAPSSGQTDLNRIRQFHCEELIGSGLNRFKALSARDERTRKIIHELTGKFAELVCDPVLLYKFPLDTYKLPKGTPRKDYMVVYSYDARFVSPSEIAAVKEYAKKNRLLIVSPGTYHGWCDVNIVCNALEWLKCIQGAKVIVTDTFHGVIASAITNRPMAIYYSKTVNSSKMLDLVSRLGLRERLLGEVTFKELERVLSVDVDMVALNERIDDYRQKSITYLKNALSIVK
ncbi:polysaccharide pyruvyl transferase family protein [Parabacteroides sp. ZJ-118]|uniref:polysaccharide pyruvyl transferase family protein n=1 Tax=Parabacteroides sp. ZJ-118 TaxID=2709398 RepID=UPI0013EAC328|nr:polysaccharide pyruvyl transferase family protein [Parabacteroides sp. ZJ-118]